MTIIALASLAFAALLAWYIRRGLDRPRAELPPEERPDYRTQVPVERSCPECGVVFLRCPLVVERSCDVCVARRFEASVLKDKLMWLEKGWEEKG